MKTILITGAAGDVGTHLRRELAGKYRLRCPTSSREETRRRRDFVRGDIAQLSDMLRVTKGVDAIVHLGGFSVEGPWDEILRANIVGCYNVFEAARRNGVKRMLFPTSNHAIGFYRRDQTIDHRVYPKPDSRYGVSKVFGEQLGSLYADKYGLRGVLHAHRQRQPRAGRQAAAVDLDQPRDLAQLVRSASSTRTSASRSCTASRATSARWYDNSNAQRLGYQPQDDTEPYATEVLAKRTGRRRSGRRTAPGRGFLRRRGGAQSRAATGARGHAHKAQLSHS